MSKTTLLTASGLMGLAVIVGAFGAHGLKPHLSSEMMAVWQTGVQYHFYHALGLLLIGVLATIYKSNGYLKWSVILLASGIVLFSGSRYAMALTGIKVLGAITPIGGVSFIGGWVLLFLAVLKK